MLQKYESVQINATFITYINQRRNGVIFFHFDRPLSFVDFTLSMYEFTQLYGKTTIIQTT